MRLPPALGPGDGEIIHVGADPVRIMISPAPGPDTLRWIAIHSPLGFEAARLDYL